MRRNLHVALNLETFHQTDMIGRDVFAVLLAQILGRTPRRTRGDASRLFRQVRECHRVRAENSQCPFESLVYSLGFLSYRRYNFPGELIVVRWSRYCHSFDLEPHYGPLEMRRYNKCVSGLRRVMT